MTLQAKPTFRHRQSVDGVIDSICPKCFLTVSRSSAERSLAERDTAHVRDSVSFRVCSLVVLPAKSRYR
jgi:hypothetical protein